MKRTLFLVIVLSLVVGVGCQTHSTSSFTCPILPEAESHPWTHLEFKNNLDDFRFAIMTDRFGGHRPGVFKSAVEKINLLRPEFVMCVGDLISGYTDDEREINRQWDELDALVDRLEMPFFYVPGNHDITNTIMENVWTRRYGAPYYYFVYKDVLFLCLDSEDPPPTHISDTQIDYVSRALKENTGVRWTFVFLHKPLWTMKKPDSGWNKIERLLKGRSHSVFAGHHHRYVKYERNNSIYIKLATTGGGSDLIGPEFGSMDHITWVSMTGKEPRLANLTLEGIVDENIVTEDVVPFIDPLVKKNWISPKGIISETDTFTEGATVIQIKNEATIPLKVKGSFKPHAQLAVSPDEINTVLLPGTEKNVSFTVRAARKIPVDDIAGLDLEVTATYEPPDRAPLSRTHTHRIFFDTLRECRQQTGLLTVDGQIDDWTNARFIECRTSGYIEGDRKEWQGPEDCRLRFATVYDERYVYVAVESYDDRLMLEPGKRPWDQDGFSVFLDARPDPERSAGRRKWNKRFEEYLVVEISPGRGPDTPDVFEADRFPVGLKAVCVRTDSGLIAEMAIPVSYLNDQQKKEWEAFRLDIGAIDFDEEDGPRTVLWWKPRWGKPENFPASGTFYRGK